MGEKFTVAVKIAFTHDAKENCLLMHFSVVDVEFLMQPGIKMAVIAFIRSVIRQRVCFVCAIIGICIKIC